MRATLDAGSGGEADRVATFAADFPQVVAVHERDVRAAQGRLAQQQRLGVLRLRDDADTDASEIKRMARASTAFFIEQSPSENQLDAYG